MLSECLWSLIGQESACGAVFTPERFPASCIASYAMKNSGMNQNRVALSIFDARLGLKPAGYA
jgi:hypothetical protein